MRVKHRFSIFITSALAAASLNAQAQKAENNAPQLVVGIVINGLNIDNIELLRDYFGQNGFNRLLNNGLVLTEIDYGSNVDATTAIGIVYTGASPSINGVTGDYFFNRDERRTRKIFFDSSKIGNFTNETLSPAALLTTTISDEIKINNDDLGRVYALSPNANQAILLGGHAATAACWITDDTGKWATTTFYKDLPPAVQTANRIKPLSTALDTKDWRPLLSPDKFSFLPKYQRLYPFRVSFNKSDPNRYKAFKESALVNEEVTNIACDLIKTSSLGKNNQLEMININYTAEPYNYIDDKDNRAQLYDSNIRIDGELDRLFNAIDKSGPGMNNTLVFVVGTPEKPTNLIDESKFRINSGEFSPSRAVSLLNMYLMSLYGNGDYVSGYNDKQFYLNHKTIKDKGLQLDKIRHDGASFLRQMSGVSMAETIDDILDGKNSDSKALPIARNININKSGDIFIAVTPGWTIIDSTNDNYPVQPVQRIGTSTSSAFILSPRVKSQTITTPVDARAIAPTVTRLLRIRSPNGAELPAIRY